MSQTHPALADTLRRLVATDEAAAAVCQQLGYGERAALDARLAAGLPPFSREEVEGICAALRLDGATRNELLRLRGDLLLVQPDQCSSVVELAHLEELLTQLLGREQQTLVQMLAALLTEQVRGQLAGDALRDQLAAVPLISFERAQMHDVKIDTVAGRDVIRIDKVQLILPPSMGIPPAARPAPRRNAGVVAANPFGQRGRIDDPAKFFGRTALLHRVFDDLAKGSNLVLIGPREIGKSSLLAMIQRQGPTRLQVAPETIVTLDMQLVHSEADFFEALCFELNLEPCRGYRLARQLKGRRFILCLDEIEKMRREHFSAHVRQELRGLADGSNAAFSLVIASSQPLNELFPDQQFDTSPLHNICSPLDVPPFSRSEAREFLANRLAGTGVAFSADEIADLLESSGRHPARLQQAAAALYDMAIAKSS